MFSESQASYKRQCAMSKAVVAGHLPDWHEHVEDELRGSAPNLGPVGTDDDVRFVNDAPRAIGKSLSD
jgi:hypothetical protein